MSSLDGTSLFIILTVIVLLVMSLSTPMTRVKKTRNAGKSRQKRSGKEVLNKPMEKGHIINLIKTQRAN